MNQDSNNLNQNDLNTQGSNGIPNNQDLNNTFNQNVNVNQPTFSSQPQVDIDYQQPTNQTNVQEPVPQPMNSSLNGNASHESFNSKPLKKMNLGLILGIIAVVAIGIGVVLGSKLLSSGGNNDSNNSSTNGAISKDGIKKIDIANSLSNAITYVLKNDGTLYVIDSFSPVNIEKMVKNVENFIVTSEGLFFTTFDKKSYIINGEYDFVEGKNLETSQGTATLIELENIKNVVDYNSYNDETGERPILFLTEDGSVYKYIFDISTSQHRVEKVMDNVKELYGDFYNKVLVDNNNTYYVFGFNKIPNGILGTSDFSFGSSSNNYVTYDNKKEVGKNLKDVTIVSNSEHIEVYTIDSNNDLSVIGFGGTYDYEQTKEYNTRIDTPLVFESNVEKVYPDLKSVYLKKTDGSLWHREFFYGSKKNKKIVDKNIKDVYLSNDSAYGILILMENNDLYAYGENSLSRFGVGEQIEKYDEPTKIFSNVSNVYDFTSGIMIVTKNNEIYYSGERYGVSTWTKLEI